MVFPKTIIEVEALIRDKISESIHLDFKSSSALSKEKKDEIIKDVSAFANSDGGVLLYGVLEEDNIPVRIDDGVDNTKITREWIEQILNSNISPSLSDCEVIQIPIDDQRSVYSVKISKSYRGPHQSSDKKYYKRYNYISAPMDHYEIEDVRNRQIIIPKLLNAYLDIQKFSIRLVLENTGTKLATNVKLKFEEEFNWPIQDNVPYAFISGIKHFPPGKKFNFYVGFINILRGEEVHKLPEYRLIIDYDHPETIYRIKDEFLIDFKDLSGVLLDKDENESIVKSIKDGFKEVTKEISAIKKEIKSINGKIKR